KFLTEIADLHQIHDEKEHVGDVDLPGWPEDSRSGYHHSALDHHPRVYKCYRVAANKHKHVGAVAEAIAYCSEQEKGNNVVGNVGDEDHPVRQPAKKVEPQIAALGRKDDCHCALRQLT